MRQSYELHPVLAAGAAARRTAGSRAKGRQGR